MRGRRLFALFVLVAAIVVALAPSAAGHAYDVVLMACGLVIPTIQIGIVGGIASSSEVQPVALLSLRAFRAPPVIPSLT